MTPLLLLVALLGVLARPVGSEQVKLRDVQGKVELSYSRVANADSITETEDWKSGGTRKTVASIYSTAGALVRRTVTLARGEAETRVEAQIDESGASLTTTGSRGAASHSHIPLRSRSGIVDASVFWFVKDKPAKGATATFMSFDPEERYWQEVSVTFGGRGKLGKSPEGNLVTRKTARKTIRMLLDDKGVPLVWEDGRIRLTR
jgi:hypothetical protein